MTAVSVVVPTVDRVALLDRCLRGLAAQDGVTFEVLVVHDGDPGVTALLQTWTDRLPLRPVQIAERGAAAKRNAGWRTAGAPVIAFVDDDCEPAPGWLKAALDALDDGVDLVQGRVEAHPDDGAQAGLFSRTIEVHGPSELYPNANLVYRRSALGRVGGYDDAFAGGEDTDLAWRVLESGGTAVWAPEALVWHAVRSASFADHVRSLPRWHTLALVLQRHPQLRKLAHRKVFWKRSHPTAALAGLGLLLAPFDRRALALVAPLLARRVREAGVADGVQLAAADVVEVGVMAYGSVRHRTVLL
ncbi:MAG: glycosyl transferase family 2 [Actinomycetia bacterium]|nr:glycosyl transferase family 2 [Actinomycetes bacterium]